MKGKKLSKETKEKLHIVNTGRKFTDEHRANLSKAHLGKHLSEEHKKNISKVTKGKNNPMYGRSRKNDPSCSKKVAMIDKETKEIINIFDSVSEAGRYLGKGHGNIANCCRHEYKSAYGYYWEFLENIKKEK